MDKNTECQPYLANLTKGPHMHSYQVTIHEAHLDTFGHVNNAKYLELYEQARWDLITNNGYGLDEIKKLKIGPVVLEVNLNFKREITNREVITIESTPKQLDHPLIMEINQRMLKSDGQVASVNNKSLIDFINFIYDNFLKSEILNSA